MSRISSISSTTPYLYGHISSANRLMSAADGAAELAIVENEKAQVTGYNTGTKNLGDGTNMLNTSDSALGSITSHLQRMRELGLRASNATLNGTNRADIQKEVEQLKQGIEYIATQTRYNGMNMLDGSMSKGVQLVSDAGGGSVTVNHAANSTLQALGIEDFDVTKDFDLQSIDDALTKVTSNRSTFGAQSNSLDHAINYNGYASTNLTAAQSRMGDTDIAKAIQELTHQQTMQSISMMLQKKKAEQEGQKTMGLLF